MKKMLPLILAGLFGLSSVTAMAAPMTANTPAKATTSQQIVHKKPVNKAATKPAVQKTQAAKKVHKKPVNKVATKPAVQKTQAAKKVHKKPVNKAVTKPAVQKTQAAKKVHKKHKKATTQPINKG
ncbi:acid resistance repetitive basic protein Asr [Aeromonas schubertii]|uniref:Acid resistance repetitive basic protein Asr n=1 Tax=Aeromonas schubertii TaxID=652 RepID=A0ABS7VCZ1_9GAMM|nr:acid resistance repetitive basic protein Asr [Aeromonas schubertii]MBZ6066831.1 acid resistance repetitive basic protein Asr [Aeromonas schubertii]